MSLAILWLTSVFFQDHEESTWSPVQLHLKFPLQLVVPDRLSPDGHTSLFSKSLGYA